jgi:plastocyanin
MRRLVVGAIVFWGVLAPWASGPHAHGGVGQIVGTVTVRRDHKVVDARGVVLYLVGFEESPPDQVAVIRQHGKRFEPDLLPITAGQEVSFPNDDPLFHNVFSLSPARKFDLGQYPAGQARTKRFPKVGVVDVYCNIHPEMAATILVLPNRRFTRAAPDGAFRLDGVPAGRWSLYAYSRRSSGPKSVAIEVGAGTVSDAKLALDETRLDFSHSNKYGENYREPTRYR